MKFRNIFVIFSILFLIPLLSAETSLGLFEQSTDIELLQVCSNETNLCDYCNISSVKYPNSTIIFSDISMTQRTADFNYSLISNYTSPTGKYFVNGVCGVGNQIEVFSYTFDVTINGNENPEGIVIVLFTILFVIIFAGLIGLLLYNVFHMIQWDFDAKDLIINVSTYISLFAIYILGKEYFGNSFFNDSLVWLIGITALTNVIVPIVAFVLTFFKEGLEGGNNYV